MCNLHSVTTNQAAIIALFRVVNRYVGNLRQCRAFFGYPAPVIRNTAAGTEMVTMRWGMPLPPRTGGPLVPNNLATLRSSIRGWGTLLFAKPFSRRARRAIGGSFSLLLARTIESVCLWLFKI
jgi:hypothetical protein